jgi:hypothetical protein
MTLCSMSMRESCSWGIGRLAEARTSKIRLTKSRSGRRGCGKEVSAAVCAAAGGRVRSACRPPPSVPWSCAPAMHTHRVTWDAGAANSSSARQRPLQVIVAALGLHLRYASQGPGNRRTGVLVYPL